MGNGVMAIGPQLPRPSSTLPSPTMCSSARRSAICVRRASGTGATLSSESLGTKVGNPSDGADPGGYRERQVWVDCRPSPGPARATKVAQISRRLAEVGNRGEVRTFEPTSAFGRWPITARDPLVTSGLDRGFDAPVLYNRTPSMTDFGVAVGTIRVNSKPAFANKSRNSGSQRSRPPVVITSIFRSMNLPGSGSSPG